MIWNPTRDASRGWPWKDRISPFYPRPPLPLRRIFTRNFPNSMFGWWNWEPIWPFYAKNIDESSSLYRKIEEIPVIIQSKFECAFLQNLVVSTATLNDLQNGNARGGWGRSEAKPPEYRSFWGSLRSTPAILVDDILYLVCTSYLNPKRQRGDGYWLSIRLNSDTLNVPVTYA